MNKNRLFEQIPWQLEPLPFDAQQRREVMARFGLAAYHGQCVERQIALMLATMYNKTILFLEPEARDKAFDREFTKTLGRLAKDLGKVVDLPRTFEGRLVHAVKRRNWLTHHYFWERAAPFISRDGREEMISELQEVADYFAGLDDELKQVHQTWLDKMGITEDKVKAAMSKMKAELERSKP